MKTKSDAEQYFDQAAAAFLGTFKSCARLQQETAEKCLDLAKGWSGGQDWTKSYQELGGKAMPQMKKAAEDSLKFWEENAKQCMALLGEGFSAAPAPSFEEAQAKLQKLWEDSLQAMRDNTESMLKVSSEAMEAYADFMKKHMEAAETATAAK